MPSGHHLSLARRLYVRFSKGARTQWPETRAERLPAEAPGSDIIPHTPSEGIELPGRIINCACPGHPASM